MCHFFPTLGKWLCSGHVQTGNTLKIPTVVVKCASDSKLIPIILNPNNNTPKVERKPSILCFYSQSLQAHFLFCIMPRHNHSPSLINSYSYRPPQSPTQQRKAPVIVGAMDHEASRNRIEWLANLDTESRPGRNYRRTSIICTIGRFTPRYACCSRLIPCRP